MAAISLFRGTNVANVTSCEGALNMAKEESTFDILKFLHDSET